MVAVKRNSAKWWRWSMLGCCLLLFGCHQASMESECELRVLLTADDDVNPDIAGRPSPILLWMLQLSDDDAFCYADFYSLVEKPHVSQIPGVITRRALMLRPGERKTAEMTSRQATRYFAVVAEFRDLEGSVWRQVWPVDARSSASLQIRITRQSIVSNAWIDPENSKDSGI